MAQFCLVPQLAEKFKKAIVDGEIDPQKLSEMTSKERHKFFADMLGEHNASKINALFESKLLLKNQQAGMVSWAKKVTGISEPLKRDIISKIERMDKILSPKEEDAFLEDLVSQRLGLNISFDEATKISDLSQKVTDTKGSADRMEHGRAIVELRNYTEDLKREANKFSLTEFTNKPFSSVGKGLGEIAGNTKAIKASLDNSALFRQGWKTMWTHPDVWAKNSLQSFKNLWQSFGGKEVMNELNADIVSRPSYDMMKRAKLDVGTGEEAFPTSLPEKIPVFGKLYKATETAYTAFVRKTRADVFDKYIDIAKKSGVELDDRELKSIGKMVNSLTGRGHLGSLEPIASGVNNILFSPRAIKAHIDTLLQPITGAGGSNFVRKQAAINLLKVITGSAAVLVTARAINKDSVDLDPRSADFGKIKVGDTRFDVTGGAASLLTLAARFATGSTKSTSTGIVSKLNTGDYGGKEFGKDVAYDFFQNKLSPVASIFNDLFVRGTDSQGNKPTAFGELNNLITPLPITTYTELKNNPNSANILLSMIADGLGVATNTYGNGANWNQTNSVELNQFKEKVGQKTFDEANQKYNQQYSSKLKVLQNTDKYKASSSDDKQKAITKLKDTVKSQIFRDYKFNYKKNTSNFGSTKGGN